MVLLHSTLPLVIEISQLLIQWLVCSMEPPASIRTFVHGEIYVHVALAVILVVVVAVMEVRLRVLGWSPLLAPHWSMLAMMSTS